MAITKLPRSGIADDAINADKIEDGTIQATEITGTVSASKLSSTTDLSSKTVTLPNTSVTSDMLVNTTIANAKLSNSAITVRGTSRALGSSFSIGVDVDWQSVKTGDTTMIAGQGYFVNTSSGAITMTLPSSASRGDTIAIKDYAATFGSNKLTIARNGHNIQGVANNSLISTNRASIVLVYVDSTKGWLYTDEHNVADLGAAAFTQATGGTVTESGDYKIHTFTGDGCFVVSQVGNGPGGTGQNPAGGPNTVSYLVLAGGGGSQNGNAANGAAAGGGGGGFREGRDIGPSYTASPLVAPGLTITATTFPISVGAGGASGGGDQPNTSNNGSNSVFSTITSAGGGTGASYFRTGGPGGSGGGGSSGGHAGGSGNTPPVSPSQGNNGGAGFPQAWAAGGGGGAGGAGGAASGPPVRGGNAGAGVTTYISGSPVGYAGGGNGRGDSGNGSSQTSFGGASPSSAAAANRGGGDAQGAGSGKGVVIIRYKFQ